MHRLKLCVRVYNLFSNSLNVKANEPRPTHSTVFSRNIRTKVPAEEWVSHLQFLVTLTSVRYQLTYREEIESVYVYSSNGITYLCYEWRYLILVDWWWHRFPSSAGIVSDFQLILHFLLDLKQEMDFRTFVDACHIPYLHGALFLYPYLLVYRLAFYHGDLCDWKKTMR